ncbi:MAG: transcriptional regulator, partial [Clostridia bacterium]|nr:transcriptional regulator [Clostridia bacterium]
MFDKFDDLADFYKTLGDETRLRILFELEGSEKCVCDISENLGMTQSAV